MDSITEKARIARNEIETCEQAHIPPQRNIGIPAVDEALDWLCESARSVIDFGCGNGTMLFLCALRGTRRLIGIDPSPAAIQLARESAALMKRGKYEWIEAGPEALDTVKRSSVNAAILSGIADTLAPDDAQTMLAQIRRIVRPRGRVLVMVSPYLSPAELARNAYAAWGDPCDDRPLLWNLPTEKWVALLRQHFNLEGCTEAYDPEREQLIRLFTLQVPPRRNKVQG